MNELDILKWAAGADIALPRFERFNDDRILYLLGIDEERVADLIEHHRLAMRFLRRFQKERPGWCSRSLPAHLSMLSRQAQIRTRKNIKAVREIASTLASQDPPLITIKGFSAYALTGDEHTVRYSGDLDLFSPNVPSLLEALGGMGYIRQAGGEHHTIVSREDIRIEVHHYFPVVGYTGVKSALSFPSVGSVGCRLQTVPELRTREIRYEHLVNEYSYGVTPETTALAIPNPTMAVFLLCAHLFRDITVNRPDSAKPSIRLAELAEIGDLVRHAQFDARQFLALTEEFCGDDAVQAVGDLMDAYFGFNPLPTLPYTSQRETKALFPKCLTWWTCLAPLNSQDDLLLPADLSVVIGTLGAETVLATTGEQRQIYTAFTEETGIRMERAIAYTAGGEPLPIAFSFAWEATGLSLELSLLDTLSDDCFEYAVDVRGGRYSKPNEQVDIDYSVSINRQGMLTIYSGVKVYRPGRPVTNAGVENASATRRSKGYTLRLCLPWDALPVYVRKSASIPILLIVVRRDKCRLDPFSYPAVIVPLNIVRR